MKLQIVKTSMYIFRKEIHGGVCPEQRIKLCIRLTMHAIAGGGGGSVVKIEIWDVEKTLLVCE